MKTVTAVVICAVAAMLYVGCAKPESNTNSANGASTANAGAGQPASTPAANPAPAPSQGGTPTVVLPQPGPTVAVVKSPPSQKPSPAATAAPSVNAADLFGAQKCTTCHGADGKGKLKGSPDFTDAAWQKKKTDAEMIEMIKKGHKPMPPYEGKITDSEITALVAYVRS